MLSSTTSHMKPADRVRQQWHVFEQWVETAPRVAMEKEILDAFQAMDAKWNATPARTRISRQDHERSKTTFRRELEDGLVTLAREEWQRRLEAAGLRDEDWGEMTFKETLAAEKLLGGDLDEEGMAIMESLARADDAEANTTALPTHVGNFTGYSFVSPLSLSIADELDDDTDAYESIFSFEHPIANSAPESIADEIFDAPTSTPWGWTSDASSYGIWSADTSQSSRQSSQTGSPERPPPKTMPGEHSFFPRAEPKPQSQSTRAPRYIGPTITDPDEVHNEEADFERFKMETRVAKIREFHAAAADADIKLAQDIYYTRAATKSLFAEHERRMLALRREKEEERKEIVRVERLKRREAIRLRQMRTAPSAGWGVAESPRERLTQEVESKLKLGSGFFVAPEPVIPPAETRRERRQSYSTMSASQPSLARSARQGPIPELDRLAASVSDLLESASTVSSSSATSSQSPTARPQLWFPAADIVKTVPTMATGSTQPALARSARHEPDTSALDLVETASSISTSSAASSQLPAARPQVWLPSADVSADVFKPTKAGRKKAALPTVNHLAAQFLNATMQGPAPSVEAPPNKPTSVDPRLPSPPKVVSPFPPKPVVSSKSQAPPPPPPSKRQSPPAPTKAPSPPTSTKAPSPPVATKAPAPPTTTKAKAKAASLPTVAKPSSPPTATKVPPPPPATKTQPPSADTPKPMSASALPQKKARAQVPVLEIQTPGASSSRTTLEQMQRPFIHRSLGSDTLWAQQIAVPPPGRDVWVSSSTAAKKPISSSSAQIAKAASMPPAADTVRVRRMSDPVSPSPRSFAFPDNVHMEVKPPPVAEPSALKKAKQKSKRVTMEEVSDEEETDTLERLPVDSKIIFEPKPSAPATRFAQIFDFAPDAPPAPAIPPILADSRASNLAGDGKSAKEKHVRWTASAFGNAPNEVRTALEAEVPSPASGARKGRSRTGSLLQSGAADRKGKGKGKERAVEPELDDDFARFMMGATQDLTQMRA